MSFPLSLLKKWAKEIPTRADWVFFETFEQAKEVLGPRVRIFSKNELLHNRQLYSFAERSWHGYAASRAACFARLRAGQIERLAPKQQELLAQAHRRLEVPSLLSAKRVSPLLRKHFPVIKGRVLVTTTGIRKLSDSQRLCLRQIWIELHPWLEIPPASALSSIPLLAQREVLAKGLEPYLNFYFDHTGPNCLATAAAISCHSRFSIRTARKWMSGESFIAALKAAGYRPQTNKSNWTVGDVAIFNANGNPVHAAYCLGPMVFVEKGGQDFYNPIALTNLKTLIPDWSGTTLTLWRKKLSQT